MQPKKLVIIHVDDNPQDRKKIARVLGSMPDVEYGGGFGSAEEAVKWLSGNSADIVLLDIELPGKDGIWLARRLSNSSTKIAFMTAHPEYAVAAFEIFALHYLVKPVTDSQVKEIIDRIQHLQATNPVVQANQIQSFASYVHNTDYPSRIFLRSVQETLIIELDDVMFFSAKRSCTEFEMATGEKITASKNLKVYHDFVAGHPDFIRVHRSYVVNKNYIRTIMQKGHTPLLGMKNGATLEVSYFKRNDIIDALER